MSGIVPQGIYSLLSDAILWLTVAWLQQYIICPWNVCKVLSSSKLARLNLASFVWSACVQTDRLVCLLMDQIHSVIGLEWGGGGGVVLGS